MRIFWQLIICSEKGISSTEIIGIMPTVLLINVSYLFIHQAIVWFVQPTKVCKKVGHDDERRYTKDDAQWKALLLNWAAAWCGGSSMLKETTVLFIIFALLASHTLSFSSPFLFWMLPLAPFDWLFYQPDLWQNICLFDVE